ncbi:MAG: hypothetical protein JWN94_1384 [Betaproteobacteria bacterium]|nr:hypothetical protein [Betaproteobacteria bacterium]
MQPVTFAPAAALVTPMPTLKARIFNAGGWTIGGLALGHIIRLGSNLLMTRLLVPEVFGMMAIAALIMYGLALFSDLGLRQNIVQSARGNDAAFLNTAWLIQIARGVLLWLLALAASLLVVAANHAGLVSPGTVYAEPELPYVIAAVSLSAVILGFASTRAFEASRKLALGRVTQIEIVSQVAGLVAMLAWVAVDRTIWALVAGSLCSTLIKTVLSHVWMPGTANRWQWDAAAFDEILRFGKWIFLSSILGFVVNSGDRLLLSALVTSTVLGVYVIAFLIFAALEQLMSSMIGNVLYSALSEIARERPADLRTSYYRFHSAVAAFAYFSAGALMVGGHTLIGLLYDPRYADAGWMLEILAAALITVPFEIAAQCFVALGKPALLSNIIAARLAGLLVLTPLGFYFGGLHGALWGIALSYFACLPPTVYYCVKHGLFDARRELLLLPLVPVGMLAGKAFNLVLT